MPIKSIADAYQRTGFSLGLSMVYEPRVGAMESICISKKVLNYICMLHFIGTLYLRW